ncbi:MAG TPA: hypothetical protein PLQ12_00070 [Candidatus Defluviicoccus seviourii]|nr:hypothetical protein [Defluviicoccus sp.]HOT81684.1 hypothetical protein [Candidatus Defluviicoccus seviourii]
MRRPFAPAAAVVSPIAALLLTACVDTTNQQSSGYPYGSPAPTYGPSSGSVYAPGYGTPYGYQQQHRDENRDHSRYFYPENNVRCDRATSVCEKWRGREQGFQPDPSETKDYFGKGARRELLRDTETSPPPKPAVRSAPLPGPRPPAAPPPPVVKGPPPPAALSLPRSAPPPPPAVERKAPPPVQQQQRRSGEEWLKQQSPQ